MESMDGSDKDYNFKQKRHWRRWLWNRIAERVKTPESAVVLYLAGTEDAERELATERGFRAVNMLAVEREKSVIRTLRDSGVLCIDGELQDVLYAWPVGRRLDVVVGDFCCGLEAHVVDRVISVLGREVMKDVVYGFNFQRGRDASTNGFREMFDRGVREMAPEMEKHRGLQFYFRMIYDWARQPEEFGGAVPSEALQEHRRILLIKTIERYCSPSFGNYQSITTHTDKEGRVIRTVNGKPKRTVVNYDSCVFQNFCGVLLRLFELRSPERHARELERARKEMLSIPNRSNERKSIVANLAHRTMRINEGRG